MFLAFFCISMICAMVMLSVTRTAVPVGLGVSGMLGGDCLVLRGLSRVMYFTVSLTRP